LPTRRMKLRYAGTCAVCATSVPQGAEAEWNSDRRTVTCLPCLDGSTVVQSGRAGGSARAIADQLRAEDAAKVARIKQAHPILGRIVLAVDPEPDRGKAWAKGAVGEEKFGAKLDELAASRPEVLLLHDRRMPRFQANIDHIAVTPNGIWVIDAKRYTGRVAKIDRGGWLRTDYRLTVGGKDRTKKVDGVHGQVKQVRTAVAGSPFAAVPIHGALCFIEADWALFAKPFAIDGVLVAWGEAIRERLVAPGPLDDEQRHSLHRHLARSFPPAHASG
jgi:hypothetical protein